jgi:hypothetical protein
VLGLAGWLGGVLIVITTMPGTPLDHELLAMLGVGVPVGLGVYLAWLHGRSRGVGFAAAVAGGLVGAYLGFHATADLAALLTAIVGAVAGANLTLIALDIAQARAAEAANEPGVRTPAAVVS